MKDNILLHYTKLKTACRIIANDKLKMSFFHGSKDPLEAAIAQQSYHELGSPEQAINHAENVQILSFAKATFPVCGDNRRERNHFFNICHYTDNDDFPDNQVVDQAMFYNYGNYGAGVCFILDREKFEKETGLEGFDIGYDPVAYRKHQDSFLEYLNQPCDSPYGMFSFKHERFSYEKELRFFKKEKTPCYLSITESLLGICMGPRLTTPNLISNRAKKRLSRLIRYIKERNKQLFGVDYNNNLVEHNYSDLANITYTKGIACFGPPFFVSPEEWTTCQWE